MNKETIELAFNDFGLYVRRTRKEFGMTLQELADRTDLSPSFIYRIEAGKRQALINTRLIILLCGFHWDTDKLMAYFERILLDIEEFKRITN